MRIRVVAITFAVLLCVSATVLWVVDNSAAGQYDELLQRAYAFIAIGASGPNGDIWMKDATDLFVTAAQADPSSAEAHLAAGLGLEIRGDTEQAVRHYEKARSLAPSLPVDALIGDAFKRQGDYAKAQAAYMRALDVDPFSVLALDGLAQLSEVTGRPDEAVAYLQQIVDIQAPLAAPYLKLSQLYLRLNDPDQAFATLEQIEAQRRSGDVYYAQLGLVHEALQQDEEACQALRVAMRLGTSNPAVSAALHRLSCVAR